MMCSITTSTPLRALVRRPRRHPLAVRLLVALVLALTAACRDDPMAADPDARVRPEVYNPDWTEPSHGKVPPNYEVAFPQNSVNTIEIVMTATQWAAMRENMRSVWGFDFGAGSGRPCCCPCPDREPSWFDVTFRYNDRAWRRVGFRLKGNSSLETAWGTGNQKLPFRLKFDEFADSVPAIEGQRFYGFRELSFAPGFMDESLIREKVTADIYRMAGVPAPRTAFYRVFIDFGEGLRYAGVYTAVEVIEDTMVKDQFGEDRGNLYKPVSTFQEFKESEFEKKNNTKAPDYSDVRALVTALNSGLRRTDPARWRAELEAVFDVDHFLKWLAVNNAIVNWDTYGVNAHNFYLYNHSTRKLTWIPWDNNVALHGNPGVTGPPELRPVGGLSLSMNELDDGWPLIRYLVDDPVYNARYRAHLKAFYENVFTQPRMDALFDRYHQLIAPYVLGPNGERPGSTFLSSGEAFSSALSTLKAHVSSRRAMIESYLR